MPPLKIGDILENLIGADMMMLLEAHDLKVYIKDRLVIDVEHLQINKNDRIGLVGANGSGKTTLLHQLAEKPSTKGTVKQYCSYELLPQIKRVNSFKSGGEVTQEYINNVIQNNPELLLLDEPTTHLDTNHIEWLEKLLQNWQGAFIVVSHDRAFLDALCTTIWELREGKVIVYSGNYSDYFSQKMLEQKQHEEAYEKYQEKKKQLEEALVLKEKKAAKAIKAPKKLSNSEARIKGAKPYFAKKQKKLHQSAKALETRLAKLDKVEKPKTTSEIKMNLPNSDVIHHKIIIRVESLSGLIGNKQLWKKAHLHVRGGDKLAIVGPNGSGKTTLIKKVVEMEKGVIISPAVKIGYFSQNLSDLDLQSSILENVQTTSIQDETLVRTILARLHFFRDDVYKPVHVLSGGERVKVALAKLFVSDINTLVLDEPTNFLDIDAVEALEALLLAYEGTIIFVSHDRRFVEKIATRILPLGNDEITVFEGTYSEYKKQLNNQNVNMEREQQLLLIETKMAEVLSRLSVEPSEELDAEFNKLLKEKKQLIR